MEARRKPKPKQEQLGAIGRRTQERLLGAAALESFQYDNYHRLAGVAEFSDQKELLIRISIIEEDHLSMLSSIRDPRALPLNQAARLLHWALEALARFAQAEDDGHVAEVFDYMLLNHLTQLNLLEECAGKLGLPPWESPEPKLPSGRPIKHQWVGAADLIKKPYDAAVVNPLTPVHVRTALAIEKSLHSELQWAARQMEDKTLRQFLADVRGIAGEHVVMVQSLKDPKETPLEDAVACELAERVNYRRCLEEETDEWAKDVFQFLLHEDDQHILWLGEMLKEYENRRLEEITALGTPAPAQMDMPEYARRILESRLDFMPHGDGFAHFR